MSMKPQPIPEAWRAPIIGFLEYGQAQSFSPETLKTRRAQLVRFAKQSDVPPSQVDRSHITAAMARCKSQSTRRNLRNALVTFFRWCFQEGFTAADLSEFVPRARMANPHPRPCPEQYIEEAMSKATESERVMLALAAEYGLRRGEIAQVHSDNVVTRDDGYSLVINGKGDKQRILPIRENMAQRIQAAKGYVFPGRFGGHVEVSYISKHLSRLLPDGWSAHKLRHRFATTAYAQSHDMLGVSHALGHSSTVVTEHYVALPDNALCTLVNAAALPGESEHIKPCAPRPQTAPPRRANGSIRYPYDGKHGKETASDAPEAVRMALMLTLDFAAWRAQGVQSFDILAEHYAELHRVRAIGHARRSSVVRAAARRLAKVGMIELVPNHLGRIRGNICHDTATLCALAGMLAAEYASKVPR
ncbi:tyrosine-type recombinase/integrase [Bifidobacterium olomucense]|uniref:Integrase n=1 Tax=Bifidobacterium olomucense TaxID=2675324 RepID=A0A7Y0EYU2_9BIFI|nr:tyrosine-type recombinase/integrase [Bifidobacterium sp. DSM 109959]NMM98872.1 integrase [Bifidobacterium sp. DSM 109959]